jgi:DNA repair exonuclease SbcCD ATPase subunit
VIPTKPTTRYPTESEAIRAGAGVDELRRKLETKRGEVNPHDSGSEPTPPGDRPVTHYPTEKEAVEHQGRVLALESAIEVKTGEVDPYSESIEEMRRNGIQAVDWEPVNQLGRTLQHQEYLLDLLTNKKSFVRKRIIEQNLGYLNARLGHYLDRIGLPHRVVFQNDLGVEITELGRDLDFDSLSRGERNRVILSLSFAFRDVFENLFSPVNLMFIDELMDNGMDTVGIENGLALLKDLSRKRKKSVWLVSHKDELMGRVDSVLHVVKEGGYTTFRSDDE